MRHMSDLFVPSATPPGALSEPAHWFLFQGNHILVRRDESGTAIPVVAHPDELGLKPLRTQYLGPEEMLVAAKIAMPADCELRTVAEVINAAEARVRAAVPAARVIYLEPDLDRALAQ